MTHYEYPATYASNPRMASYKGRLWVRLTFKDGRVEDGTVQNDLFNIDPSCPVFEYWKVGNERAFVETNSLARVEVMGVLGVPDKDKRSARRTSKKES